MKEVVYTVNVEFGDCDPAKIVWFPNFFRWIDAASRNFFIQCGVPTWTQTEAERGIIGTPIVDTKAKFIAAATYGDTLYIHASIPEWRAKSFVQRYRVTRDGETIMECEEVRIFAGRRDGGGIRALPIPEDIRALCE
jgi:4-hydroxybenzoyl-CoA thioesterase